MLQKEEEGIAGFLYEESTFVGLIPFYVGIETYLFPLTWTQPDDAAAQTDHLFL